jgi:enoyl-CoA hydratase
LVAPGTTLDAAIELGDTLARFPQHCLRNDRRSSYEQWHCSLDDALRTETRLGFEVVRSGETLVGAQRFAKGAGRHGRFE